MKKLFIALAAFCCFGTALSSQSYIPVEDNPFGPRPIIAPVPSTVSGVADPVINISDGWLVRSGNDTEFRVQEKPVNTGRRGSSPAGGAVNAMKKVFTVPASFSGNRVWIRFSGTGANAILTVNGRQVRDHWAHTYAWGADITDFVEAGKDATVILEFKQASGGLRGRASGINEAKVYAVPQTHVQRARYTTDFDEAYKDAELELWVRMSEGSKGSLKLSAVDSKGKKLSISPSAIKLPEGMDEFKYKFKVKNPLKWDAEHPNLYDLTLSVTDEKGKVVETVVTRYGFREAYRIDDEFFVNGRAVKFRGLWGVNDPKLLKDLNINHTRQIGTTEQFLNAADEYGVYVLDEMSPGGAKFGPEQDPEYKYQWIDLIGDLMERDYNHPCVIMWGLGNESFHGDNVLAAFKFTKADDKQRMTMYSWANRVRPDQELPYDVYSNHYARMSEPDYKPSYYGNAIWHSRTLIYDRQDVPKIPTLVDESTHALLSLEEEERDPNVRNFWGQSLKDMVDRSWADKGSLGFDQYGMSFYVGVDPIPEMWHIRKACSPVSISRRAYDNPGAGNALAVEIENRFNHTDLSELTVNWKVGEVSGTMKGPKAAPKGTGTLLVPYKNFKDGDVLELSFIHPDGRQVDEYRLDVAPEPFLLPQKSSVAPKMEETYKDVTIKGKDFELLYDKYAGQIKYVKYKGKTVISGGPHLQLLRSGIDVAEYWPQSSKVYIDGNEAVIDMDVIYSPISAAFQVRVDNNGLFTVNYTVKHTPDPAPAAKTIPWNKTDCGGYSEVGIKITLPSEIDRIQWNRKGLWSVYPEDHVGREKGIAYKSNEGLDQSAWSNWTYDLNWWSIWEAQTPREVKSPSNTTNDFRASKEYFRTAAALLKDSGIGVEALSEEKDAVRMELSAHDGPITMIINNEWNYPTLGVGNYMKPPIAFGDGYTNTVHFRLVDFSE